MINIKTWARAHQPSDEMLWKAAFADQVYVFSVVEQAMYGFGPDVATTVLSTHTSKSIELPVVHVSLPMFGLEFLARNNSHDWNIAVRGGAVSRSSAARLWDGRTSPRTMPTTSSTRASRTSGDIRPPATAKASRSTHPPPAGCSSTSSFSRSRVSSCKER